MNESLSGLGWFLLLLLGNGFFVGAEFALIAAKRASIEPRAEAGSRPAKITLRAMERVSLMLATSQIGVTVCSLLILVIAEPAIANLLHPLLVSAGAGEAAIEVIAFSITLALVTFLHVLVGELIPKQISFAIPERMSLVLVPLLYGLAIAFKPIVVSLNAMANLVVRIFQVQPKDEANSSYTLDQVEDIVEHSTREGVLSDTSGALSNTFEFTAKQVHDVQVAVDRLVSFDISVTPRMIEQAVSKHGFSRYPISENGEVTGYLHLKDVLDLDDDSEGDEPVPAKRVRSLISVAAGAELEDALALMKRAGAHLARVFDENGQITGMLFLEDILEELVGEVQDATRR